MARRFLCAIAVAAAGFAGAATAAAEDAAFAGLDSLDETEMAEQRGANAVGGLSPSEVLQSNKTTQTAANSDNEMINSGTMVNGTIGENNLDNNRGSFTVFQNTGNFVNMANSTSVNIHLK